MSESPDVVAALEDARSFVACARPEDENDPGMAGVLRMARVLLSLASPQFRTALAAPPDQSAERDAVDVACADHGFAQHMSQQLMMPVWCATCNSIIDARLPPTASDPKKGE